MKYGLHLKASQAEQKQYWEDTRKTLLQSVRVIPLFAILLIILFTIQDWFSAREIFKIILITKSIAIFSLLMIFYLTFTKPGKKHLEMFYLLGIAILFATISFQADLMDEDFMVPIAVIMISVISAVMFPWRSRYQIILILISIYALFTTVFMMYGFPPALPLGREFMAGIVFSIATLFLAIYSNDRRFEFWLTDSALRESEEQFRQVAEHSHDIIWICSPDRKVDYISPAYEQYVGNTSENVLKNPLLILKMVHPDDRSSFKETLEDIFKGVTRKMDFRVRHNDGTVYHLESWGAAIRDQKGEVVRCVGIWHDVTERVHLIQDLDKIAVTDPLTQIYNRRYFYKRAQEEVDRVRRSGNPFSFILFDIDFFKNVNDTHGHFIGDKVLIELAEICQEELRNQDIFARYGGEEFVVLLPETDIHAVRNIAERLREIVASRTFTFDEIKLKITISLGISIWNNDEQLDVEAILDQADQALYQSKEAGRNRVTVWNA